MKRKKFVKYLMSEGIGRNAANYLAKRKSAGDAAVMASITSLPGFVCVTGVAQTNDGLALRVKREVKGRE